MQVIESQWQCQNYYLPQLYIQRPLFGMHLPQHLCQVLWIECQKLEHLFQLQWCLKQVLSI
ncbi:MAG: hypothetical protein EBT68_02035 [Verrucomicrobia bacterium]|nr:hypothetical protein [Verrucomicrobiota bacterium]